MEENLPNLPPLSLAENGVVRVNDGHDSGVDRNMVIETTKMYTRRFFNTAIPVDLEGFPGPVVLTVNPGEITDKRFYRIMPIPKNLMMIRFRVNCWNLPLAREAVDYYTTKEVPVILTFMAYHNQESIPESSRKNYIFRTRTQNPYWAITTYAWRRCMEQFEDNLFTYSCGKIEGEEGKTSCARCGNCVREFHCTRDRMGR